ncbi:hypothetical protein J4727_06895 [Providencia rettgeri]|uniref:Uncharacterized protein n=1 Tax=Providencia rettgeri TaxID=587 RepID=A0A939NBL9_PRORE|nr:hypothetical protein [Providencia rettgeri]
MRWAITTLRDGELVLSFEVEAGIFAGNPLGQSIPSIYWYYLVDRLQVRLRHCVTETVIPMINCMAVLMRKAPNDEFIWQQSTGN